MVDCFLILAIVFLILLVVYLVFALLACGLNIGIDSTERKEDKEDDDKWVYPPPHSSENHRQT